MPLRNLDHHEVFRRIWANSSKRMINERFSMIVKGKVIGTVEINDIGRRVNYHEFATFNESEIRRSKDLQEAVKNDWVQVMRGVFPIKSFTPFREQVEKIKQNSKDTMTKEEMLTIAREMAQTMAIEMSKNMVKNDETIRKIALELANEIVNQILEKGQLTRGTEKPEEETIKLDDPKNIFIDINEGETKISSNLKDVGTVKEEKSDISDSLEKMKLFRRKQGST